MTTRILAALLAALLSGSAWTQPMFKIAGQEGDERFFPLIRAVYERMGYDVSFDIFPSARALALVDSGVYDAEMGRIREIEKDYQHLQFTNEPLLRGQLLALVRKGFRMPSLDAASLRDHRIGYVIGMSLAESYAKTNDLHAVAVGTHDQLAHMLDSDRIDVALMVTVFPQSPVYKIGVDRYELATFDVYHILNVKNADIAARFDRTLIQMKKDGTYAKLLPNDSSKPQKSH